MSLASLRTPVLSRLLPVLIALPLARPAFPQDLSPALDPVVIGQNLVMVTAINAQAKRDAARLRREGRLPVVSPATARTRFVPTLARRRAQADKFMAAVKRANPDLAASLAPAFKGDPIRFAQPALQRYGLRADDVADATAVYLASAWYGANGKTEDPTRGEVAAVRDQMRRVFLASPKLARSSDATKQNVAEGTIYLAFVNDAMIATMKTHPEAKARLQAEIAAGAKSTFGLDLNRMKLTRLGLEPKA